jgi:FixJ family two-component response regulator
MNQRMKTGEPIVHIVDDDASYLSAVSRLLQANGFEVRTFSSAADFLQHHDIEAAGCVVADLRMPGLSGLGLQASLAGTNSSLPVVFLTGQGDIASTVRAMRGGAEDFLEKRAPKEDLLDAVRRALARNAREREARTRLGELRARFDALTQREREVLAHVARGRLNKQIAADLGIHERTVKLHRTAITTKLGVRSMAELLLVVQQSGMAVESGSTFP